MLPSFRTSERTNIFTSIGMFVRVCLGEPEKLASLVTGLATNEPFSQSKAELPLKRHPFGIPARLGERLPDRLGSRDVFAHIHVLALGAVEAFVQGVQDDGN